MPTIKVENRTDDTIIITLNNQERECANGEDISFENCPKGEYLISVHRKRIPKESTSGREPKPSAFDAAKSPDSKPGSHVQLDSEIKLETNSAKAVVSIIADVKALETLHEDVIFVGYRAKVSGAKVVENKDSFASAAIKKTYVKQQFKGAFLPVGLIGIITTLAGAFFLFFNIGGYAIKIAGNEMSLPYSLLITAGGLCVLFVFITTLVKIKRRVKELWHSPKG